MSSTNIHVVAGRLGADAKPLSGSNGRSAYRFSIATDAPPNGGEKSTCWIPVVYWTGNEREIEYLKTRLVKGAMVVVNGPTLSRRYPHPEYPIDMVAWDLNADRVDIISAPVNEATSTSATTPVRPSVQDHEPELTKPLPAPPARPAPAASGTKLQF